MRASVHTFFAICLLSLLFACKKETPSSQTQSGPGYDIQVKIGGMEPAKAYLAYYYGDQNTLRIADSAEASLEYSICIDSTTFDSLAVKRVNSSATPYAHFVFEGDTFLKKGLYQLSIPQRNTSLEIVIDADQYFSMSSDTADIILDMEVEGSKENYFFYENLKRVQREVPELVALQHQLMEEGGKSEKGKEFQEELKQKSEAIESKTQAAMEEDPDLFAVRLMKAGQTPRVPKEMSENADPATFRQEARRYLKANYWENTDFSDDRFLRTNFFRRKLDIYTTQLVPQKGDSVTEAVDMLVDRSRQNPEVFRFVLEHFFNKYAQMRGGALQPVYIHIWDKYYVSGEAYWVKDSLLST